jgi:sugar phosphate isomerase/epimerase
MKIGIMNNPAKSIYDEVRFCGEAGFDFVDLTLEGPKAATVDVTKLRPILDRHGLFVVGHTDPCLPHAYPIDAIRKACLNELERCAILFAALGARVMNIHPCYFCPPGMRNEVVAHNIEVLPPLVAMAASHGLTVVIENFSAPFDRVSTFKKMIAAVPGLKLHLDFGHTNFGLDSHALFCAELGTYIRHVHFSDNRSRGDDHMPLGVGNVDWKDVVSTLKATGYDGTITLEVFCDDPEMRRHYLDLNRKWVMALWNASR